MAGNDSKAIGATVGVEDPHRGVTFTAPEAAGNPLQLVEGPPQSRFLDPGEVLDRLARLGQIPAERLPGEDPARLALVWLISARYDVYCYTAANGRLSPDETWNVWLGPLALVRPGRAGRVELTEWRTHWQELLAEMGVLACANATA